MPKKTAFLAAMKHAPIVPVVTIQEAKDAVPLAEALLEGGVTAIEITLRTDEGLKAIEAVAKSGVEILIGAGTVISAAQMQKVCDAGAQFVVSPGTTPELLNKANELETVYLPGVVTPSEVVQALAHGHNFLKFFPAGGFGGAAMLKHYASVFPSVRFCPTGGITPNNLREYLALPNVICVGGSWLAPKNLLDTKDWVNVTNTAQKSLRFIR